MTKYLKTHTKFEGIIIDVYGKDYLLSGDKPFTAEVVHHPGGVCIAATPDNNESFFVVKQYRYGADKELIEFPAGLKEAGEDPLHTALRELEEETGYVAQTIIPLGLIYLSPGFSDEVTHLYYATDLTFKGQNFDENESLVCTLMPFKEILAQCASGEIEDAKTVALALRVNKLLEDSH